MICNFVCVFSNDLVMWNWIFEFLIPTDCYKNVLVRHECSAYL